MSCCGTSKTPTLQSVQNYYGKVLSTTKDLKTSACTAAGRPHDSIVEALRDVPDEIKQKFYGCGAPLPLGIDGLRVLDLGSGSGRDCYVASKLVGENGVHSRNQPTAVWRLVILCEDTDKTQSFAPLSVSYVNIQAS